MLHLSETEITASIGDAALHDLGGGICCLEFRSKGNSITPAIKEFLLDLMEKDLLGFDGMVIGSESKHFSAGADLSAMLDKIKRNRFDLFEDSVNYFQQMNVQVKRYGKPIVAAPYGMTLGGGLEIALHAHARVAREKSYMGLVEVGVGLLPSGGGTKETALCMEGLDPEQDSEKICALYDRLLLGTVSQNAANAARLGYLNAADKVVAEASGQLDTAKDLCRHMVGRPPAGREQVRVTLPGRAAYIQMAAHAEQLLEEGRIAPHDLYIGRHIARILAGSDTSGPSEYTEQQILDTERACFIDLLRHPKTQERIEMFLKTGQKLRN